MAVTSYLQLIFLFLLVIFYTTGQVEGNSDRHRRQAADGNNRNAGASQKNPNEYIAPNNIPFNPSNNPNIAASNNRNNQQQPNNNLLAPSGAQGSPARSRGFYDSPSFRAPAFSGDKPVGWFETKQANWVSNLETDADKNKMGDGKNAPPSSLKAGGQPRREEDDGRFILQKVAKDYVSRGEKTYHIGQSEKHNDRSSVCINRQNFDGFTFGKFRCPLPPGTGMNQLDQFCCGFGDYQYCCNAQEFNQNQAGGAGDSGQQRYPKHPHYSRSTNRALAIVLPIAAILVIAGAVIIVFLYYKRLRSEQSKNAKPFVTTRPPDDYSAVPQNAPIEKSL